MVRFLEAGNATDDLTDSALRDKMTTLQSDHSLIYVVLPALVGGVLAIIMMFYCRTKVTGADDPTGEKAAKMTDIAREIQNGAREFLITEYKYLAAFVVITAGCLCVVLGFTIDDTDGDAWIRAVISTVLFIIGAILSGASGWVGMMIATEANVKTTQAATTGTGALNKALRVAFSGGAVMGFCVVGFGILGVSGSLILSYLVVGEQDGDVHKLLRFGKSFNCMAGFGFGASSIALFARVAGGIYTKAADVGADLVGKVEAGIPEDDPRNPGVIADNVGDNVGDVAGMGADLFESFVGSIIAAGTLGLSSDIKFAGSVARIAFPFWLSGLGIIASVVGFFFVQTKDGAGQKELLHSLHKGVWIASFLMLGFSFVSVLVLFSGENGDNEMMWNLWVCVILGLVSGVAIGEATERATSFEYSPTISIAKSGATGPATVIIQGLGIGMLSCVPPCVIIVATILACAKLADVYGVAVAAVGMLSTLGVTLATDAYGPVADNAGGIAEMAELDPKVRDITDNLDALGNTTAATGKGFAIGSAVLTALALTTAFSQATGLTATTGGAGLDLNDPVTLSGVLFGAVLPYLFAALTMLSVGKAAGAIIDEVRRQFRDIPGLMEGTAKPENDKCVRISTESSIREMILPGLLAVFMPLVIGTLVGKKALGGMLVGALSSGFMLAVMMANAGGAWDNAKKYIETQNALGGKGTEPHKAAVVGDTVGDPFKDTSGPALNILIKLMSIISLTFAPLFQTESFDEDFGAFMPAGLIVIIVFVIIIFAAYKYVWGEANTPEYLKDGNPVGPADTKTTSKEDLEEKIMLANDESVTNEQD